MKCPFCGYEESRVVDSRPAAIAAIQGEGYQIVPVSQLLLSGSYLVDHEGRQVPQP